MIDIEVLRNKDGKKQTIQHIFKIHNGLIVFGLMFYPNIIGLDIQLNMTLNEYNMDIFNVPRTPTRWY